MSSTTRIAIALGSNLGDREAHLAFAVRRLAASFDDFHLSSYFETVPEDVPGPQALFLNAAATARTTLSARGTLARLLAIEREHGRERPFPGAARTIDLDLILFGVEVIEEAGLSVPHPRFRERRFVLEPLCQIAPDALDPVSGLTMAGLLARLPPASSETRR